MPRTRCFWLTASFAGILLLLQAASASAQAARDHASTFDQRIAELKRKASHGDAGAQVDLGMLFAAGNGVPADEIEAVRWYRKAAEQGNAAGEYALGEMYFSGRGVPLDNAEALKWLRRSAEHGDARGQYNLAAMYSEGRGVEKDDAESAKWLQKAAEQDFAAAQFGLGTLYAHGRGGLPHDDVKAEWWYRKAMQNGDFAAMNNLALLLATSKDSRVLDRGKAVDLALKLVETDPQEPVYLDTLAAIYYENGQTEKAAETEKRALALNPDKASYREALEKYQAAAK